MHQTVRILNIQQVKHNVRRYVLEKPAGYRFEPGQATELSLDEEGWRDKRPPVTFTPRSTTSFLYDFTRPRTQIAGSGDSCVVMSGTLLLPRRA